MPIVYMLPKQFEETYRTITGNYTEIRMNKLQLDTTIWMTFINIILSEKC